MKNEVIDGLIYAKEIDQYVEIPEWLQHIVSVARTISEEAIIHYAHCGTGASDHWFEPYIDIGTEEDAKSIVEELTSQGIYVVADYYERFEDDQLGLEEDPEMLWGVRIPGVKLSHKSHIECKRCIT
tara:strand:- start:417 stop:797 length:381 start_codon:yes stop_codon:yes gene_type:complete